MNIIIELDARDAGPAETIRYCNVSDFAIVGTRLEGGVVPRPFIRAAGDYAVICGKLAELAVRLASAQITDELVGRGQRAAGGRTDGTADAKPDPVGRRDALS